MTIYPVIQHPSDTFPSVGEYYRLVYAFDPAISDAEIHATWPQAISMQVDQNPYFSSVGYSLVNGRVVVDTKCIAIPQYAMASSMEDMLDVSRRYHMSSAVAANIVVIQQIDPASLNAASRDATANQTNSITIWKQPSNIDQVDTSLSSVDKAVLGIEDAFKKIPGYIGSAVNTVLSQPAVFALVAFVIYLYIRNRKGA